ncbi:MAG: flagellar motor switch protein FliM [Lachnospiraceae bacterium]|jgi:flagellar motor switch protein FliM|nr:flagellar motor switch protein FliM [Lachnospiraceae bacterium]MCI9589505.1 flagellar motor switch protein FliM [Lachnospiraceae bacterium]
MADVLSQSQIDALLKSMQTDGPVEEEKVVEKKTEEASATKYNRYDFYSPRKFTKEKMKILTSVFENYARILTSQVNGIFRVMTDITVLEVQECRYYEYVNSFHENDCLTLVDVFVQEKGKNNVPLMLFITPGMVITLINRMLGGGDEVIKVDVDYRYSDVELALYRRVVDYCTQALKDGFANYINMQFKVQRVEENPSMVQDVGLDETVAVIHLNVDMAGYSVEKLRLCLPGTLLENIFHTIDHRKHIARGFSYENNRESILDNIRYSQLPVTGQLGKVKLDVNDIYHLRVGDVIDLNKPQNGLVTLYVGRQPWFTGEMGRYKKNVAVRIQDRIYQKKDEDENTNQTEAADGEEYVRLRQMEFEEPGVSQ